MPQSAYAIYTWSVIITPSFNYRFYQVGRHALMSWQRFDYAQMPIVDSYFPHPRPTVLVSLMVAWGRTNLFLDQPWAAYSA
jgi:hypothetical protein